VKVNLCAHARFMGMRFWHLTALLVLGLVSGAYAPSVGAVETSGLYQATVPVGDRAQASRDEAFRQALAQVLVKVSGNSKIVLQPAAQKALKNSSSFVQEYAYAGKGDGLRLQVKFEPEAINQWLIRNKLPLWSRERPVVIWWVGVEESSRQRFILGRLASAKHGALMQVVEKTAALRGVPVIFPLLDLEDRGVVSFSDLAGGFISPVERASSRYEANAEVIGILRRQSGEWVGRWQLEFSGQTARWRSVGVTPASVLENAVNEVADHLAKHLAVVPTSQKEPALLITFRDVQTAAAFARIEHLLRHFASIRHAYPLSIDGDRVRFRVIPRGQPGDVARNLALTGWLRPLPPPFDQAAKAPGGSDSTLYYRYMP